MARVLRRAARRFYGDAKPLQGEGRLPRDNATPRPADAVKMLAQADRGQGVMILDDSDPLLPAGELVSLRHLARTASDPAASGRLCRAARIASDAELRRRWDSWSVYGFGHAPPRLWATSRYYGGCWQLAVPCQPPAGGGPSGDGDVFLLTTVNSVPELILDPSARCLTFDYPTEQQEIYISYTAYGIGGTLACWLQVPVRLVPEELYPAWSNAPACRKWVGLGLYGYRVLAVREETYYSLPKGWSISCPVDISVPCRRVLLRSGQVAWQLSQLSLTLRGDKWSRRLDLTELERYRQVLIFKEFPQTAFHWWRVHRTQLNKEEGLFNALCESFASQ